MLKWDFNSSLGTLFKSALFSGNLMQAIWINSNCLVATSKKAFKKVKLVIVFCILLNHQEFLYKNSSFTRSDPVTHHLKVCYALDFSFQLMCFVYSFLNFDFALLMWLIFLLRVNIKLTINLLKSSILFFLILHNNEIAFWFCSVLVTCNCCSPCNLWPLFFFFLLY